MNITCKTSIGSMLKQCAGLRSTRDISDWEDQFLGDMIERVEAAQGATTGLSGKQVESIERIWVKHFA
jgi:peptide deformylase